MEVVGISEELSFKGVLLQNRVLPKLAWTLHPHKVD